MQRSSQSIASLAAALAKAQAELVNPEKSLVATIRADGPRGAEQTFRYAPLSSGLDIVRKTLGQHEIATVQTTAIDQTAGIVNLTTVLAHASGEWIASDWPVCAISDTATPHRMGAALTYARRYALFTLVGIAGEDDLDAPDLVSPTPETKADRTTRNKKGHLNDGPGRVSSGWEAVSRPTKPVLDPDASAALCEQLAAELKGLNSTDDAANWARRVLGAKNTLTAADAARVEQAFEDRLANIATGAADGPQISHKAEHRPTHRGKRRRPTAVIDKTVLALSAPRRVRDREHVKSVAKQPCLVCGRRPADAHHLRSAQSRALGRKVSDEFTVPLCRGHHREVHHCGDECAWWDKAGIDPTVIARALWLETHPLPVNADKSTRSDALDRRKQELTPDRTANLEAALCGPNSAPNERKKPSPKS
jgi:hypothetical protein